MGMGRYVVDAVLLEGRSAREVARTHGISKTWIYELIKRYRAGGYEALEPRSRRPRSCPSAASAQTVEAVVQMRAELEAQGHDAGAATIAYHLKSSMKAPPSRATVWRILGREGLISPQPQKRPHCSLQRFEAQLPNEMWQADITCWALASGEAVEILNLIDDPRVCSWALTHIPGSKRPTSSRASRRRRSCTDCRNRFCPTTEQCSRAPIAAASGCSSASSSAWACCSRTHAPTTRRRAGRLSACTRRSSAIWQGRSPPRR